MPRWVNPGRVRGEIEVAEVKGGEDVVLRSRSIDRGFAS